MTPQLKQEWVEALRSGEYTQGKQALCTELQDGSEEWCPLGILVDIAVCDDWELEQSKYQLPWGRWTMHGDAGVLSEDVCEEIGLSFTTSRLVAEMNDMGRSFEYIASWIESHL